jgi:AI-2 transport protein TqsA
VLLPFVLAVFFTCGLVPILDLMQKWNVPRPAAIALTFVVGLISIFLLWGMIWISVSSLIRDSAEYRQRVDRILDFAHSMLEPYLPGEDSLEERASPPASDLDIPGGASEMAETLEAKTEAPAVATSPSSNMRSYLAAQVQWAVQALSAGLFELMGSGAMIAIFMFFMLTGDGRSQVQHPEIWKEIESRIREYIVMKTLISLVTGLAVWIVLWFYGIPLAMVFGLLAFLMNFIPNIGPMIMCVLPLPLVFLSPHLSLFSMLWVTVLLSAIQFISGSIVEPKIMGSSFQLHPVVIMLTLLLWGLIWGLPGMFLSTPITAAMKIVMEQFAYTRPIAELLAGNWKPSAEQ